MTAFALTHNTLSDIHATHTTQDLSKMPSKTFSRKMTQLLCKEPKGSSSIISPNPTPGSKNHRMVRVGIGMKDRELHGENSFSSHNLGSNKTSVVPAAERGKSCHRMRGDRHTDETKIAHADETEIADT